MKQCETTTKTAVKRKIEKINRNLFDVLAVERTKKKDGKAHVDKIFKKTLLIKLLFGMASANKM